MVKRGVLLIGLLILLTGCINIPIPLGDGNTMKIGTDGITFIDEDKNEHKVNIDEENETFSIDGVGEDGEEYNVSFGEEDGNISFNFSGEDEDSSWVMGENLELPFEVPESLPMMDDANVFQYANAEGNITVQYFTEENIDNVLDMYESYFNNQAFIENPNKSEMSDDEMIFKHFEGKTNNSYISVSISTVYEENQVTVSLTVQSNEEDS